MHRVVIILDLSTACWSLVKVSTDSVEGQIDRIAAESCAKVGGQLFSDTASQADGPAATYVDMARHNTALFTAVLSGQS